ncbi:DUF2304 domain-containing protein [uncultured Cellulomonas sp.]|uniref:DUF2304 domain-containing protein n=1 Tax=uncultured Cellulomonas sp. TaxID=189682 RepID=UPI002624A97C|nr:DUF2304 domain-containing protein [uncultured Cellulomonas sp.]
MSGYLLAIGLSVVFLVLLFVLLSTRRLREKYAAIWIALALGVCVLGAFPGLVFWLTRVTGVEVPANLVFALAMTVLLAVCLQLSGEISNLEEETRTIAEEHALLEARVRELEQAAPVRSVPSAPSAPAVASAPCVPPAPSVPDGHPAPSAEV